MPRASAALAFPEPVSVGSAASSCLALRAFEMAIGPRKRPKQKMPVMAYFSASPASAQSCLTSAKTGVCPCSAMTLHEAQYDLPLTVTRHWGQKGSWQPAQRLLALVPGWLRHSIGAPWTIFTGPPEG